MPPPPPSDIFASPTKVHDEDAEPTNNDEEQFVQKFFNRMRKHPELVMQVPVSQINLDIVTRFTPSSAGSAPDNQRYPVDDIKVATPCTLLYVKGRTLKTIKVANTIVMSDCIMHDWLIPSEYAVVEVTTIKEGHEFEDFDYPNEDEGIEKLKVAKGNFILWPRKDIILKPRLSPIVSPQSKKAEGTPTSEMPLPSQDSPLHHSSQQQELLDNTARGPRSPPQHHSL
jgi:hypothetical protein